GSQRQFITKLLEILNNELYSDIISWNNFGTSFIVKKVDSFSQIILPKYFKSNNFNSFIRQLNMYNFHKVKNANFKGTKCDPVWEFENENFIRNKPELLKNIKRK
ncbi:winged helix DNA-binding domain-containing protein, partial [Anaeromyces robustus]